MEIFAIMARLIFLGLLSYSLMEAAIGGVFKAEITPTPVFASIKEKVPHRLLMAASKKSGVDIENIYDYKDMCYIANITVGNPPQSFQIDLDTGSSDFWVLDAR